MTLPQAFAGRETAVETLRAGALALGVPLSEAQLRQFRSYAELLIAANRRVNLTAIADPEAIEVRHFLDSLTCALPLLGRWGTPAAIPPLRCVDLGSGGGFPGVVLQLALPQLAVTLVETTGKKADFLRELVGALRLQGATVVAERAETIGQQLLHREAYDVAFARALASLPVLLELSLPLLRQGGLVVAPRRGDTEAELTQGAAASALLGGGTLSVEAVTLPALADGRVLVSVEKLAGTPAAYPRRPGLPAKRPLPGRTPPAR